MKFLKAFLIWLLMLPLGILNGGLRIYVTEPLFGSAVAQPLAGVVLSVLIFLVAFLLLPKIGKCTMKEYVFIGIAWFVLTNAAELVISVIEGIEVSEFFWAFDVRTGNLWSLVVIVCLVAPVLVAKIRKLGV